MDEQVHTLDFGEYELQDFFTENYTFELAHCTDLLLREIKDKKIYRKSLAMTYALALMSRENTDWKRVNQAIIKRWSLSGLEYIKESAWKIAHGK